MPSLIFPRSATVSTDAPAEKLSVDELIAHRYAKPRIIFALDATASRQPTWDSAAVMQAQMFTAPGNISAQLVYYRGWNGETRASQWFDNPNSLADAMNKIQCMAGETQIRKVLKHAGREHALQPVSALIIISDACEEQEVDLVAAARETPVPVFLFQEGRSDLVASIYRRIAELTGGALAQFDASSAAKLADLLKAVAAFATGGVKALAAQKSEAATLLVAQMKR